jgi:hypothetical protein
MNTVLRRYAQKKAKQIDRQNAPRWSGLLTALVVFGFVLYTGWGLISGEGQLPADDRGFAAAPEPDRAPDPAPDPDPVVPVDPEPPVEDEPQGSAPEPVMDDGATAQVPGPGGTTVTVPAAAREVALASFEAFFDADAAARVPTVDGNPLPSPAAPDPAGEVTKVRLSAPPTPSVLQFAAEVDLDGPGEQKPVTYYRTVMLTSDGWAATRAAG